MKQAINILIAYLTCTDPVIQNKWLNLLSSFWHKDSGWLLKSITPQAGGYKFTVLDSDDNEVEHIISVPVLPNSQPISYIQDLQTTLDNKVDKVAGKSLSTNDFTTTLKTKLDNLVNYVHPDFHQISEIADLQDIIDTLAVYDDLPLVAKTNDYNDLDNKPVFKVVQKEYLDMAALYADQVNQSSDFIQYVIDASAHPDVEEGNAYFEYLSTLNGDDTDYRLLSAAESAPITVTNKLSISEIIVKDKSQIINQVLDSTKIYKIDTQITLLDGESIIVPESGLTLDGHGFNISTIFSAADNHTIFTSPVGGSGDLVLSHLSVTTVGANSKVFDVHDVDGTHAIEIEYANFSGCTSLGKQNGYRQGTWTTVGVYGCDDGLQISGSWSGYKISNTNCFGFAATGILFKKDVDTIFGNRLFLNINVDLPTGAILADFQASNFTSNELFQVNSSIAKLNGVIDEDSTSALIPNISANDAKALFVGNIGLYNSADERYVEDAAVVVAYNFNWLKDTYFLTMTGNTTFTQSNLPASGKNSEEIKIYLAGNYVPTFPAGWTDNLVGTYKGDEINEITVKFVKTAVYFMSINNTLTVYPAPDLQSVSPQSVLPSSTSAVTLFGSFFTPSTIVELEGQTVNSIEFVNSGELILSVTSGATEGEFDITISNGTSVTFTNALIVNVGVVHVPIESEWTIASGSPDVSTAGEFYITTYNTNHQADWNVQLDYTIDWAMKVQLKASPLGVPGTTNYDNNTLGVKLLKVSNSATVFYWSRQGTNADRVRAHVENDFYYSGALNTVLELRFVAGVFYLYRNNILVKTYTTPAITENLKLRVYLNTYDVIGLKYIELP